MPALLSNAHVARLAAVLAATTPKKSTGSPVFLILIVVMVGVYLLWLRPQRKRQQAQMRERQQAEVGDEVVTSAGIYGKVVAIDGDRVSVEIAPGTTIEIAKRAMGQRIDPVVDDEPTDDEDDTDEDDTDEGDEGHADEDHAEGDEDHADEDDEDEDGQKPAVGGSS
ncbi:MAG: preprotein translocase subunit YajC [Acidimicrobiales bacterium]